MPPIWYRRPALPYAAFQIFAPAQYWDKGRLISHSMGEHDRRSVVWDHIEVYTRGALWTDRPPQPLYAGGTVVSVAGQARAALAQALQSHGPAGNQP